MRLNNLSKLNVLALQGDIFLEAAKKQNKSKKPNIGNKKNESTAFAKAVKSSGKTQREIAKETGQHETTISRHKSGVRNPNFDHLKDEASALGSKPETLYPELR